MLTDADTTERFSDLASDLAVFDDGELTGRLRELELAQRRVAAEMAAIAGEVDRRGVRAGRAHGQDGVREDCAEGSDAGIGRVRSPDS